MTVSPSRPPMVPPLSEAKPMGSLGVTLPPVVDVAVAPMVSPPPLPVALLVVPSVVLLVVLAVAVPVAELVVVVDAVFVSVLPFAPVLAPPPPLPMLLVPMPDELADDEATELFVAPELDAAVMPEPVAWVVLVVLVVLVVPLDSEAGSAPGAEGSSELEHELSGSAASEQRSRQGKKKRNETKTDSVGAGPWRHHGHY